MQQKAINFIIALFIIGLLGLTIYQNYQITALTNCVQKLADASDVYPSNLVKQMSGMSNESDERIENRWFYKYWNK